MLADMDTPEMWTKCTCGWLNYRPALKERGGCCTCGRLIVGKEKEMSGTIKHTIPLAKEQVKEFVEHTIDAMGGWSLFSEYTGEFCGRGVMGIQFPYNVPSLDGLYKEMYEYIPSTAPKLQSIAGYYCDDCEKMFQLEGDASAVGNPRCPECDEELIYCNGM